MEVSPAPESSSVVTFAHSTLKHTMILSEIGLLFFNLKVANDSTQMYHTVFLRHDFPLLGLDPIYLYVPSGLWTCTLELPFLKVVEQFIFHKHAKVCIMNT